MAATDGSKIGAQVRGRLWLVRAVDHWSDSKMYGRILLDFDAIGAPVYADDGPDPASMDPKRPGVLVETVDLSGVIRRTHRC